MKNIIYILFLTLILCFSTMLAKPLTSNDRLQEELELCNMTNPWLKKQIKIIDNLKVGSSREDVEKLFSHAGGLFQIKKENYVYTACPLIRITVEYEASPLRENTHELHKNDIVKKISIPYLKLNNIGD